MVSALRVVAITRVGRGNTFAVRLAPEIGAPAGDLELARAGISSLAGHLRAEVSRVISRRYSPYLRFEVVPEGGWEPAGVVLQRGRLVTANVSGPRAGAIATIA